MKVYTLEWTYTSGISGVFKSVHEAEKCATEIQEKSNANPNPYKYPHIEEWEI